MTKSGLIAIGIAIGIVAEVGSVSWSFSGVNLFHGGHPHAIVNALLPGIGIANQLSSHTLPFIPISLLVISLIQFPVYGALWGRDYANRAISKTTLTLAMLHLVAASVAFYGVALEKQWRTASAQYGACIRANDSAERIAINSSRIISLVKWMEQSKRELNKLKEEKKNGAIFTPDPEAHLVRELANQEIELKQQWEIYKKAGGPANSPEEAKAIASPCGKPPPRSTLF